YHLVVGDIALLLDEREDARHRPAPRLDLHPEPLRERARDVLDPAATGDVRVGEYIAARRAKRAAQGSHLREVAAMRGEQGIPQRAFQAGRVALPVRLAKDPSSQRVAIGMQ